MPIVVLLPEQTASTAALVFPAPELICCCRAFRAPADSASVGGKQEDSCSRACTKAPLQEEGSTGNAIAHIELVPILHAVHLHIQLVTAVLTSFSVYLCRKVMMPVILSKTASVKMSLPARVTGGQSKQSSQKKAWCRSTLM